MISNSIGYLKAMNNNKEPDETNKRRRGWVRPAIAVIGFFVFFFAGAYFTHYFRARWIIPVALIAAFGWAIAFSVDWWKDKMK